jgi:hypothetical protein
MDILMKKWFFLSAGSVILAGLGLYWLKMPYAQLVPKRQAIDFMEHVQKNEFASAHAMTFKNAYVGKTVDELQRISKKEICASGGYQAVDSFPTQSNGNRLRRWLNHTEIEMPELHVDFQSPACVAPVGVTLRYVGSGQWKVLKFAAHAG